MNWDAALDRHYQDQDPAYLADDPTECLVCGGELEESCHCNECDLTWAQQLDWAKSP